MRAPTLIAALASPLLLAALAGASTPAPATAPEADEPDRTGYDMHCALCHGPDGTAVAALEKVVEVEIPHLGTSHIQGLSDEEIEKVILEGTGKMNPVISIDAGEIPAVITFVRTLKEK